VTRPPLGRLIALLAVMLLGLAGVMTRLSVLQLREGVSYEEQGYSQRLRVFALPAERGSILDASRQPLAISVEARDVYADPRFVVDASTEAKRIASVLGARVAPVRRALTEDGSPATNDGSFAYVAHQVDLPTAERLRALELPGIGFLPTSRRSYPAGPIAGHVLGFVGDDGYGLEGLEYQYDATLAGTPGELRQEMSPAGVPIAQGLDERSAPVAGDDLVTTIDRQFQYQVQTALADAVRANHARGGTVIVMDPRTGNVFAMASAPTFDPNAFLDVDAEARRNTALVDEFEPGSVSKVITAAAAIEENAVPLTRTFDVSDHMEVSGFTISDSHRHATEAMTLGDIIAESSNIGAALIAQRLGRDTMSSYMARFGFGRTTGTGFPAETPGNVPAVENWSEASLATIAYGQGLSVSPMQMAAVYATIANHGQWVQPRLATGVIDGDGAFHSADAAPTRRVVSAETADTVTRMLASVVEGGTGTLAGIRGYQVAGKTGTALKVDAESGHYVKRYMASFIGFLPASDPQVVIAVILDEPDTVYGGVAAAPLFQQVAQYAIQRLGITPGDPVALPPSALGLR
jgi:cell division protein FtsI (penicillin-binding protein 3)